MGAVLDVAGIEGFLANLDEMLATADGEGAVWRSGAASSERGGIAWGPRRSAPAIVTK